MNNNNNTVLRHGSLNLPVSQLDHRNIGAVVTVQHGQGGKTIGTLEGIATTGDGKYLLVIAGEEVYYDAGQPVSVTLSREQVSGKASSEMLAELADMVEDLRDSLQSLNPLAA